MNIALELAKHNHVYEDIASKFFEVRLDLLKMIFRASSAEFSALPFHCRCHDVQRRRQRDQFVERRRRDVLRCYSLGSWSLSTASNPLFGRLDSVVRYIDVSGSSNGLVRELIGIPTGSSLL